MPRPVTDAEISKAAKTAGIPENVLRAMLFRGERSGSNATSPKGAYGQAQLMPGTARALEQRYGINTKTAYGNVLGGALYLKEQKQRFGSWRLAFAAYNAGPGAVEEYGGVPPFKETQDYVSRTMSGLRATGTATLPAQQATAVGGGGVQPSSRPVAPPPPSPLEQSTREGLQDLARGSYDPRRILERLQEMQATAPAPVVSQAAPAAAPPVHPGKDPTPSRGGRGGITYSGQAFTHPTSGLDGFPAVDLFAAPGTPFRAPENGRVTRLSGRGGTNSHGGGAYGYSVYFVGESGRVYYITHLSKARAKVGRYKQGAVLGTVSPAEDVKPHAHVGVKGGKK